MIWQSEAFIYGLILANVVTVAALLAWAWRRGLLGPSDALAQMPIEDTPPDEKELEREPS